jgi:hypothetical protein
MKTAFLLAVAASFALAACGKSDTPTKAPSGATSAPSSGAASSPSPSTPPSATPAPSAPAAEKKDDKK